MKRTALKALQVVGSFAFFLTLAAESENTTALLIAHGIGLAGLLIAWAAMKGEEHEAKKSRRDYTRRPYDASRPYYLPR